MGFPVTVQASADAATGENYGFIVLTQNGVQRRIPYSFLVERPALASAPAVALQKFQSRRHDIRHEPRHAVLLPVGAVRPAARLRPRRADERRRR